MEFPNDNKIHRNPADVQDNIENNAEKLTQHLKKLDWKYLRRAYWKTLGYIVITIIALISSVKLSFLIFNVIYHLWLN